MAHPCPREARAASTALGCPQALICGKAPQAPSWLPLNLGGSSSGRCLALGPVLGSKLQPQSHRRLGERRRRQRLGRYENPTSERPHEALL